MHNARDFCLNGQRVALRDWRDMAVLNPSTSLFGGMKQSGNRREGGCLGI